MARGYEIMQESQNRCVRASLHGILPAMLTTLGVHIAQGGGGTWASEEMPLGTSGSADA